MAPEDGESLYNMIWGAYRAGSQYGTLKIGKADGDKLMEKVGAAEAKSKAALRDERFWTFVIACAYAMDPQGPAKLFKALTGEGPELQGNHMTIWVEALPLPPRKREGNTHLDLAVGGISQRDETKSGIEWNGKANYVFCEFKCLSDISTKVTGSILRNQLARVIENAIFFTGEEHEETKRPKYVALVTPSVFKESEINSRLYRYKFVEYASEIYGWRSLKKDIEMSGLELRDGYLLKDDMVKSVKLSWLTYRELIEGIPNRSIQERLVNLLSVFGDRLCPSWDDSQ